MFDALKKTIQEHQGYAETQGFVPDALIDHILLLEVCERLDKLTTYFEHTMVSQMIEIAKMYREVSHEQTNTQSIEGFTDGTTTTHEEASTGEAGALHERENDSTGNPHQSDISGRNNEHAGSNIVVDLAKEFDLKLEIKDTPLRKIIPRMEASSQEQPTYDKAALAGAITNEIVHYKTRQNFSEHSVQTLAQCHLDAQRHAYNKAMQTVGIKTAQEGIIGGIARGIKTAFNQARSWAVSQVASIVSTLQDGLNNFLAGLSPDLSSDDIATETEQFLSDYAKWKAPQVANYTYGAGMDVGTSQAISDILSADDLPGVELVNIRARVLPEESSSDACKQYAGHDWTLEEYQALGISWPMHPECPHYVEIYLDTGDEML